LLALGRSLLLNHVFVIAFDVPVFAKSFVPDFDVVHTNSQALNYHDPPELTIIG
jgi:hypothetical protein